jgi:hypothetical protein
MPTIVESDYEWTGCPEILPDCDPETPVGEMVSATFVLEDFEQGFVVEGVQLEVYYSNSTESDPDLDATNLDVTDVDGMVTALVPPGCKLAYKVIGGETPLYPPGQVQTSFEYDVPTPAADGGEIDAIAVSQATYMLISTVLGITPDPAKGILAGGFDDCTEYNIEGAVARLFSSTGTLCAGSNECLDRYFIDEIPAQDQHWISADGLYGVLQAPVGEDYEIQIHGILGGSACPGEMVLLGSHDGIRINPNAITIVNFLATDTADVPWADRCIW